jgi:hypothetical protein
MRRKSGRRPVREARHEREPRYSMGKKGFVPPNKKGDRNAEIVEAIRMGMKPIDLAKTYGVSKQRVSQIWYEYGDKTNLLGTRRNRSFE